ncbi:MAG: CDP-glucose 4,6-dehydratase [Parachlamydiaceae bacterium]|nr:CDP-glucose 4,6-dehydratase [Parachlamydiaceae bacterium]
MNLLSLSELYLGKKVLITGHTGFKGAWLAMMLRHLGATVVGYSLPPSTTPNLFELAELAHNLVHIEGDIRDYAHLKETITTHQPEIIFHLAAQAIVLDGYKSPKETFDVNSGGTVNVLEALRHSPFTKACILVTTDKCYENNDWSWGYRENDVLGGKDPYSASKSMAELAIAAYRSSFFSASHKNPPLIASVRAGNIIGGGDFSPFRIIPDCMKALNQNETIEIRNPNSARPWLYVLDALNGYLQLGGRLLQGDSTKADAWNFGPQENRAVTVQQLVEKAIAVWGKGNYKIHSQENQPREMPFLRLSWDKAANELDWAPVYDWKEALESTVSWYRDYNEGMTISKLCDEQISSYFQEKSNEIYSYTS